MRVTTVPAYAVPDHPADPKAAVLDLIVRLQEIISTAS
jgi:hypothetical protein